MKTVSAVEKNGPPEVGAGGRKTPAMVLKQRRQIMQLWKTVCGTKKWNFHLEVGEKGGGGQGTSIVGRSPVPPDSAALNGSEQ